MDYKTKVMSYANVIQIFSSEEGAINNALETKLQYALHDPEAHAFWVEVKGRIHRNSLYQEIIEITQLERKHLSNVEQYPSIATLTRSPNLLKWISMLPKYEEEVIFVMDYQKENFITEKPNDKQRFSACIGSLQFFNDAITAKKPLEELFKHIPLVTWSIESLLVTGQIHEKFKPFILDNVVPVLRAHKAATLIFLDLLNNSEEYLAEENKKGASTVVKSSIFTREYKAESVHLTIPSDPKKTNPDAEDPYLDSLAYALRHMFEQDKLIGPIVEQATRDWFFSPLTHLYRLRLHADLLGCTQHYTPVVSPKLLSNASGKLYTHQKLYGERNLLESAILASENIIMESKDSDYKELFKPRFIEAVHMLRERLNEMLAEGLITGKGVAETLERVKARGHAYEIYERFD